MIRETGKDVSGQRIKAFRPECRETETLGFWIFFVIPPQTDRSLWPDPVSDLVFEQPFDLFSLVKGKGGDGLEIVGEAIAIHVRSAREGLLEGRDPESEHHLLCLLQRPQLGDHRVVRPLRSQLDPRKERHCGLDEAAARRSVLQTLDLAVWRVRRVACDARLAHRRGVGPQRVSVPAHQRHGSVGHHGVDLRRKRPVARLLCPDRRLFSFLSVAPARTQRGLADGVVVRGVAVTEPEALPLAALDPLLVGVRGRVQGEPLQRVSQVPCLAEIAALQQLSRARERMDVCIVEARHRHCPVGDAQNLDEGRAGGLRKREGVFGGRANDEGVEGRLAKDGKEGVSREKGVHVVLVARDDDLAAAKLDEHVGDPFLGGVVGNGEDGADNEMEGGHCAG